VLGDAKAATKVFACMKYFLISVYFFELTSASFEAPRLSP